MESLVAVYGDCGAESVPVIGSSSGLAGIEGPSAGPCGGGASRGGGSKAIGGLDSMRLDFVSASDCQL
jgi:hypothetical protein